jgi:hypothetical protein
MTLLQDGSQLTDASAYSDMRPHWRRRISDALVTLTLAVGIAATTLGWIALLVRGAVSLVSY